MDQLNNDIINIVKQLFNDVNYGQVNILKAYKESQDKIINYFSQLFAKYGKEGTINYSDLLKYNRIESIQIFLTQQAEERSNKEIAIFLAILLSLYSKTYYQHAYLFEKSLGIKVKFKKLKESDIQNIVLANWSGISFDKRIKNNHIVLANNLQSELSQGIRKRETIDLIKNRVERLFGIRYNQSKTLNETESERVITVAQEDFFKDSKIIEGVEYTAVLDNRTTEYCRDHDGIQYSLDDPSRPTLPAHIRCRSIWTPVIIKDLTKKTEKVTNDLTFEDWFLLNDLN